MSIFKEDCAYAQQNLRMLTKGLHVCYTYPLNNENLHRLWIFFWVELSLSCGFEIYLSIKVLEKAVFIFFAKSSIYKKLLFVPQTSDFLEKFDFIDFIIIISLQLSKGAKIMN